MLNQHLRTKFVILMLGTSFPESLLELTLAGIKLRLKRLEPYLLVLLACLLVSATLTNCHFFRISFKCQRVGMLCGTFLKSFNLSSGGVILSLWGSGRLGDVPEARATVPYLDG